MHEHALCDIDLLIVQVLSQDGLPVARSTSEYAIVDFLTALIKVHAPADPYAFREVTEGIERGV